MRTVGVEEELLLVDPETGVPASVAGTVLRHAANASPLSGEIEAELQQQQIEVETSPTRNLADLDRQVRDWRVRADELARRSGARAVALATSPLPIDPQTTIKPRYQAMVEHFGLTTMEQLTCGCHVHVGVDSDHEGVAVLDRIGIWLPTLLALSANSPFWQGRDSGYASFRSQVWSRFPSSGPTRQFGSAETYRRHVDDLLGTEVLLDGDMVYFNARLSRHYPTVEVRVADVCTRVDDTVMIAALVRALVQSAAAEWADGTPSPAVDSEQLRLASWRAGRSGLTGHLVDPRTSRPAPAREVVEQLLDHVSEALIAAGDATRVRDGVERVFDGGTGADGQRRTWARTGDLAEVVRDAARTTLR